MVDFEKSKNQSKMLFFIFVKEGAEGGSKTVMVHRFCAFKFSLYYKVFCLLKNSTKKCNSISSNFILR